MTTIPMTGCRTYFGASKAARNALFQRSFSASPRTITQAIQKAVDAIPDDSLKGLSTVDDSPLCQARALLALLTLCYARQIYSSNDAARRVARDLYFSDLGMEELPDASFLRRFREENRQALHHCLTAALRFLVEQKISSGVVTKVNLRQLDEEARRRIIMAMFVDSMEREKQPANKLAATAQFTNAA